MKEGEISLLENPLCLLTDTCLPVGNSPPLQGEKNSEVV